MEELLEAEIGMNLDCCCVSTLIFALTTRAEFFFFAFDIITNSGKYNICAVALIRWYVFNIQFPVWLGTVHYGGIGTNAFASDIFILSRYLWTRQNISRLKSLFITTYNLLTFPILNEKKNRTKMGKNTINRCVIMEASLFSRETKTQLTDS